MKRICIGTFLTILSQAKVSSLKQRELFECLLDAYDHHNPNIDNSGTQGHLKSGASNLSPILTDSIRKQTFQETVKHFHDTVIPCLDSNLKCNIVAALLKILEEDSSILTDTFLVEEPGYNKAGLLKSTVFDYAGILAAFFRYAALNVDNTKCSAAIKEIHKNFLSEFSDASNYIHLDAARNVPQTPLELTVQKDKFDSIFIEVPHSNKISIPNPSSLRIYHLNIVNCEFHLPGVASFIKSNIGRYVFSRARRNEYYSCGAAEEIALDAMHAYQRQLERNPSESHFAEIMLYSFLESVLGAPKISSKIELQNIGGNYQSKSSGVHLLTKGMTTSQLVFGASEVVNSLSEAIESAFSQISGIKDTALDEYSLVEGTIFSSAFEPETTEYLKNILIPQKGTPPSYESAFGVFLGYTISIPDADKLSNEEYKQAVNEKMRSDIADCIPQIHDLIQRLQLTRYSFYIYVLPLDDAENDKNTIMHQALGGEK